MDKEYLLTENSKFHQISPQVKLVFVFIFIIFVNLTPSTAWFAYALYLFYLVVIIFVAKIKFSTIIERSMLSLPFLLAAIPLIFTGNPPLERIKIMNWSEILVSVAGFQQFLGISIKSFLSILAAVLLVTTTQPHDIFLSLERIKVPRLFISIINLAYHYWFVIKEEVLRMIRARASRSSTAYSLKKSGGSIWWRAKVTGSMTGNILVRSIERSERVYSAMVSRGYNGKVFRPIQARNESNENQLSFIFVAVGLMLLIWIYSLLISG